MNTGRRNFLKRSGTATLTLGLLPTLSRADSFWPANTAGSFARMSPESQGVSSAAIINFISAARATGLEWHSFMLLRHGHVIAEGPYPKKLKQSNTPSLLQNRVRSSLR